MIKKYKSLSIEVKASIWFLFCRIFSKIISLITLPIFTRLLSPEEYGDFSVFLSWESILAVFATFNLSYQVFNNGMVKYKKDKDGYTSSMIGLTFILSTINLIILSIFYVYWFKYTGISYLYLILMFINIFSEAIYSFWIIRNRYEYKYKGIVLFSILSSILGLIIGILFVVFAKDRLLAKVLAKTIVLALFGIVSFILLFKKSRKLIKVEYWKYALKIDLPLIPHYLSTVFLNGADRIMIGQMIGKAEAAFYSVSYQISMIMNIIVAAVNDSFAPWIYRKLDNGEYSEINNKTTILIVFVGVLCVLPMFFAPEAVLIVGGSKYMDAVSLIPVISISVFMIYLYTLFSFVELFYEKSLNVTIGSLGSSFINIVTNLIFIKMFGYKAAAYTTLISYSLLALFHYIMMKNILKKKKIYENIFNIKVIVLMIMFLFVFLIVGNLIYDYYIIRYLFIFAFIFISFIYKKRIISLFKMVTQKK